jgi:AcrR family transcriptional regulator
MTEIKLPAHMVRGQQTRDRVLAASVQVATAEGLEALTIGRIAAASALTKAGLLGHFNSKEALQIATLNAGRNQFVSLVILPAQDEPEGLPQVLAILKNWVAHVDEAEGGCFFASVAADFDSRTGPVHERVAELMREWLGGLVYFLNQARKLGHLRQDADVDALAFELHAYELSLNLRRQLLSDRNAASQAHASMRSAISRAATPKGSRFFKSIP